MRIMVRTLRGERVALDVDGATPVAQVKSMVMGRECIPVAMQRLFFAGRQLDDDRRLADYGVQHDSVVFLSLRLHTSTPHQQEMQSTPMQPESQTVKQDSQQQQMHVDQKVEVVGDQKNRSKVSHRSLRKILSKLQVDGWTSQHDAKFLDLLARYTADGGRSVGDLTADDWSAICARFNGETRSHFIADELQRRLGHFRREYETVTKIKNHPKFSYDHRRRVVTAKEADWQQYISENPEAASCEGKIPHFSRLRAIFSSRTEDFKCREPTAKRYFKKLLQNLGLRL